MRIDLGARGLAVGGEAVPLTPTEYAICEYLARHPGQVMSRAQIREAVLGWESDADDAAISMQVSRARRKLSEAGADPIATVWGWGTSGSSEDRGARSRGMPLSFVIARYFAYAFAAVATAWLASFMALSAAINAGFVYEASWGRPMRARSRRAWHATASAGSRTCRRRTATSS